MRTAYRRYLPFLLIIPAILYQAECSSYPSTLRKIPDSQKVVLLIENFHNSSIEGSRWTPWQLGLPSLMENDLLLTGYFQVVSDESRRQALKELALGQSGLVETPQELGRLLGAQWILTGSFIVVGEQLKITGKFIDVKSARTLATAEESGGVSEFFRITKSLSTGLIRQVKLDLTDNDIKIITSQVETANVEASLHNYSGEETVDRIERLQIERESGRGGKDTDTQIARLREEAKSDFREAVRVDPSYERAKQNLSKLSLMFPSSI